MLEIRGGVLEGKAMSAEQVAELAKLPPLDALRGQVMGAIVAPLMTVVGLFNAPLRDLVGLIDARIEQLGDSAGAESLESNERQESPEPEAEAAAATDETTTSSPQPEAAGPEEEA